LTESTGGFTLLGAADHVPDKKFAHRLRSAGRPMTGARVRVVDPVTLADRPVGERGEVLVAGSRIMKGYWRKPEPTAEVMLPGGWLRTGDGGSFDADSFLYLHDRLEDVIVSGGENVYPAEVESVMTGHPAVAEVAVVGVPSAEWGEPPYAVVVLRPGAQASEDELISWTSDRLAHFKCPVGGHLRLLPAPHRLRQAAETGHPVQPDCSRRPLAPPRAGPQRHARVRCVRVLSYGSATLARPRPGASPAACMRGYGAAGSASAWHAEGQGFESP
jgi:AMP-binding enzyme/AMP-binding enzyme C-terminal domain